jgi:hypothetical protein
MGGLDESVEIELEIHTDSGFDLILDFLGKSDCPEEEEERYINGFLTSQEYTEVANGVKIRYKEHVLHEAIDTPEMIVFVVQFSVGVATGLTANWLYGKLKRNKAKKLLIEESEVDIEEGEIKKVLERRIEIES